MGQRFFAIYVQAERVRSNGETEYSKRCILPPRPPEVDGVLYGSDVYTTDKLTVYYRNQNSKTHRAQWNARLELAATLSVTLEALVRGWERDGWKVSGPFVCEMTLMELDEVLRRKTTPYKAFNRVKKVAARKGFQIEP